MLVWIGYKVACRQFYTLFFLCLRLVTPVIVKKSSPKNLSADSWPSVGRQSVDSRPTVRRQTADRFCLKYRLPVGRQVFWGALLHNYPIPVTPKTDKVKFSIKPGVACATKWLVWTFLTNHFEFQTKHYEHIFKATAIIN